MEDQEAIDIEKVKEAVIAGFGKIPSVEKVYFYGHSIITILSNPCDRKDRVLLYDEEIKLRKTLSDYPLCFYCTQQKANYSEYPLLYERNV